MTSKKPNKADLMTYKAFSKALDNGDIAIYLDDTKLNRPQTPVYNPWEFLLPKLIPILIGLFILYYSILLGLILIILSIIFNDKLFKKKLDVRLFDRTKSYIASSYENLEEIWSYGGIIIALKKDKKIACLSPDDDWKEFVVKNFADLMVDKKEEKAEDDTAKRA